MAESKEIATAAAATDAQWEAPPIRRVLFVDEDTTTVAKLRHAFGSESAPWDTVFVQSGEAALAALQSDHFDAIVSDLHIAQMDGPELLAQVRERHPDVVRLCLSEELDDELLLRAVPVAHQFLRKPCNPDTVLEVVARACSLGSILQDASIRQLISRLDGLPTTPRTFQQLSAAIAKPTAHTDDISQIVTNDQALCVKTLQIVNSALFRRSTPITSIPTAITVVGLEMLKTLALSACIFNALDAAPAVSKMLADMQARSLRKAYHAHALLEGRHGADEAFTAALLLDVGQAVLALGAPEQFARMISLAQARGVPWHEVEAECFGAAHPEVGACLLGLWGLPLELIEAVAHHHRPSVVTHVHTRVLTAVHVADAVVESGAGQSARLGEKLDAQFVSRPEVARCLRAWNIDLGAVDHPGVHTHSL